MVKVIQYKDYFIHPIQTALVTIKECFILTMKKEAESLNMVKGENDLDIYYAVGNTNTQRQENEIAAIMKKRNFQDGS